MRKKLKDTGGLTFVELLCAVCILVLLCLMMSTCLNMAVNSYRSITAESETELLVSSISDALADKLRYCVMTETPGGYTCSIGEVGLDTDGRVTVTGSDPSDVRQLLPDGAYGASGDFAMGYIGKYKVTTLDITPSVSGTEVTFEIKLEVQQVSGSIGAEREFTVRCLNPVKKEV